MSLARPAGCQGRGARAHLQGGTPGSPGRAPGVGRCVRRPRCQPRAGPGGRPGTLSGQRRGLCGGREEDRTARLRPGAGGRDRGAPPGLARRVGSRSLAGSQGGNQTLRVAGERVGGGAPFLITVISPSGRPELRVLRGAGWLGDGGFPEEILETVCGSIGAFWSPRASSAL